MRKDRKLSFCLADNVLADRFRSRNKFGMTLEAVLILLTVPFYAGTAEAEVCIAEEDCNNLGYTEDKACTDGLKCPFGEKWHCPDKKCQIGWILNSDMSCTENVESGKTPIAVVVYLDDKGNGQAMALKQLQGSFSCMCEDRSGTYDVPGLPNYDIGYVERYLGRLPTYDDISTIESLDPVSYQTAPLLTALRDLNSCENTRIMKADKIAGGCNALYTVLDYVPDGDTASKGKWCLPALGVGKYIYDNYAAISAGIQKAGGEALSDKDEYWTSTENSAFGMWKFYMPSGKVYFNNKYSYKYVRPVIEF